MQQMPSDEAIQDGGKSGACKMEQLKGPLKLQERVRFKLHCHSDVSIVQPVVLTKIGLDVGLCRPMPLVPWLTLS